MVSELVERKRKPKAGVVVVLMCAAVLAVATAVALSGCGASSIVGTWRTTDDGGGVQTSGSLQTITFGDDGQGSAVDRTGGLQFTYTIEDDGTLRIAALLSSCTFEKADSRQEALDGSDLYYLTRHELVLDGDVYKKQ